MPSISLAQKFHVPENFGNCLRYDSESNNHERIILLGDQSTPSSLTRTKKHYPFLQALLDLAPNCRPEKKSLKNFEQAAFQSFHKKFPGAHL